MLQGDKYLVFYRIPRMESYRRGEFKKKLKINVVLIERGQKKRIIQKKKRKNMKCFVQMIYKIEILIVIPRFRLLSSKEDT